MDIWPSAKITNLLEINLPIIQAPMAGSTTPELVAAVSNAGALGSLGAGYMQPDVIRLAIHKIRELTNKPFAVNLFINSEENKNTHNKIKAAWDVIIELSHDVIDDNTLMIPEPPYIPLFEEQITVLIEEKVPIFSFTFGVPSERWLQLLKANDIKLIGSATTLQEALVLKEYAVDIIVAQGCEAGGHRGTFIGDAEEGLIGLTSLVPLLVDNIDSPIVAAGGIMDQRGILSSLVLGAQGVQMGTAFLSCPESGINSSYKNKLMQMQDDDTVLTRAFSGKLARGLRNKFITDMESHVTDIANYPVQHSLSLPIRNLAKKKNCTDFMSMWAGQSAYLSKGIPARELINELSLNVERLLSTIARS